MQCLHDFIDSISSDSLFHELIYPAIFWKFEVTHRTGHLPPLNICLSTFSWTMIFSSGRRITSPKNPLAAFLNTGRFRWKTTFLNTKLFKNGLILFFPPSMISWSSFCLPTSRRIYSLVFGINSPCFSTINEKIHFRLRPPSATHFLLYSAVFRLLNYHRFWQQNPPN